MRRRTASWRAAPRSSRPLMITVGLALLLFEGTASAAISLSGVVTRTAQRSVFPFYISKSDCERDDDRFRFTFSVSPANGTKRLEVWASDTSDCLTNMDRNGASPKCKKVTEIQSVTTIQPTIEISSRDLATSLPNITYEGGECDDATGSTAPRKVNLTFMLLTSPNDEASEYVKFPDSKYDIAVDLVAPPPPTSVAVATAEGGLSVTITNETAPPDDLQEYYIYCDPPPSSGSTAGGCNCINTGDSGTAGAAGGTTAATSPPPPPGPPATGGGGAGGAGGTGGAGGMGGAATGGTGGAPAGGTGGMAVAGAGGASTAGTAGMSAGGGSGGAECVSNLSPPSGSDSGSCVSCVLQGQPSELYLCGTIAKGSETGTAAVLENGTYYAVAVASVDRLGNVGELTATACGTPTQIRDFYEAYRESGGQAGGGICSVQRGSRPLGAAGPLLGALAGAAFFLRRRARASRPTGGAR